MKRDERIDRRRGQRQVYDRNRKRILMSQSVCGICGMPVDKTLRYPDPMSPTADHILPVDKGGTNDLSNLQLAHWICNRIKSDRLQAPAQGHGQNSDATKPKPRGAAAQYIDWTRYEGG